MVFSSSSTSPEICCFSSEDASILKWARKRQRPSLLKSSKAVSSAAGEEKRGKKQIYHTEENRTDLLTFHVFMLSTGAKPTTCCSITRTKFRTEEPAPQLQGRKTSPHKQCKLPSFNTTLTHFRVRTTLVFRESCDRPLPSPVVHRTEL